MRLTDIMLRKLPNGHIFRGKHRLVKQVVPIVLKKMRYDYEREEKNMLILRHPYLTVEQSFGHMKALAAATGKDKKIDWNVVKTEKFARVITLEDRLMHLKVQDAWD